MRLGAKLNSRGGQVGQLFDALPPPERTQRYREMADAAFLKAKHVKDDDLRAEYLRLAAGWHAMALELEANLRHLTQLEASQARLRQTPKEAKPDEQL